MEYDLYAERPVNETGRLVAAPSRFRRETVVCKSLYNSIYRGTSLMRKRHTIGLYAKSYCRVLRGRFFM